MDKNSRIGFLLMGLLMIAFVFLNGREQAKKLAEQEELAQIEEARIQDSLNNLPADTIQIADVNSATPLTTADPDSAQVTAAPEVVAENYVLENESLKLTFSTKGGRIVKAELKDYDNYPAFIGDTAAAVSPIQLYDAEKSRFNWEYNHEGQTLNTEAQYFNATESNGTLTFTSADGSVQQVYSFTDNPYLVDYQLTLPDNSTELTWETTFLKQEKDMRSEREFTGFNYKKVDNKLKKYRPQKKDADKTIEGNVAYVVQRQRFFNQTLFSDGIFQNPNLDTQYDDKRDDEIRTLTMETSAQVKAGQPTDLQIFIGPNDRKLLKSVDKDLVNILPKGVLGIPLVKWIAGLFNNLKGLSSNYGLIILLMTILIKLALSPLTYRSYLSQAKMQVLKPELEEMRKKFGKDQQRMSQEQMKLYSKAGVNPLGGCIPSLLQIPIFFSLYYFFRSSIYFRQKPFLWAEDLSTYDAVINLPFSLPLAGSHISLFAVLYGFALFISMRTTQGMNGMAMSGGAGGPGADMMKTQMKIMQIGMPIFLPFIFNAFPAALTFYYVCYNIINTIQTIVIKKFIINEDKIKAQIQENKKKEKKKGKFAQRIEAAMREAERQKNEGKGKSL
ncbi:MAG: membrane protein insertase YidC [Saprospiraceae bacterium]|nr:membrane protein insertase YidC [Saprospiraceae bacterium]